MPSPATRSAQTLPPLSSDDATGGVTVPLYSSRVFCLFVQSRAKTHEGAGRRSTVTARLLHENLKQYCYSG